MDVDVKPVTVKIVEDIAGVIPDATIDQLVQAIRPRSSGETYSSISKVVEDLVVEVVVLAPRYVSLDSSPVCELIVHPQSLLATRWKLWKEGCYN